MTTNKPTKQGLGRGGVAPPKERQFGQPNGNPRNNGAWKKEDTARYKLEQMMKLSEVELDAVKDNPDSPMFERKLAKAILDGEWKEIESMMNQVYGQPKQKIEAEVAEVKPLVDLTKREKNGDSKDDQPN
jgi:hypothetical protein